MNGYVPYHKIRVRTEKQVVVSGTVVIRIASIGIGVASHANA